jgi:hypothetical protein
VRLADAVLRQGHLSEQALAEALLTGDRPGHLDRCDLCADRALELGRWLDDVQRLGVDMADARFAPEQLKVQHDQILRRLDQLDQKPRVIAFPGQARPDFALPDTRRVAPAWLGVAAAAGLVLGIIGGQVISSMSPSVANGRAGAAATTPQPVPAVVDPLMLDLERPPSTLVELDGMFPELRMASNVAGG